MILMLSEEASPGHKMVYRGIAGNPTSGDVQVLEEVMPMWLMEYLLMNRIYSGVGSAGSNQQQQQQNQNQQGGGSGGGGMPPVAKLSFVLMPWNKDADVEPLPELLNT
jgi:WD repeat-containing protein 48